MAHFSSSHRPPGGPRHTPEGRMPGQEQKSLDHQVTLSCLANLKDVAPAPSASPISQAPATGTNGQTGGPK